MSHVAVRDISEVRLMFYSSDHFTSIAEDAFSSTACQHAHGLQCIKTYLNFSNVTVKIFLQKSSIIHKHNDSVSQTPTPASAKGHVMEKKQVLH